MALDLDLKKNWESSLNVDYPAFKQIFLSSILE